MNLFIRQVLDCGEFDREQFSSNISDQDLVTGLKPFPDKFPPKTRLWSTFCFITECLVYRSFKLGFRFKWSLKVEGDSVVLSRPQVLYPSVMENL